jgi:hypothetical protein
MSKAPYPEQEVARQLPLSPLLELAGQLAWHAERLFVDGAEQTTGKYVFPLERCLFLLSLAGGLLVFHDNHRDRPKPPQSTCRERAREVLEIWAGWAINYELPHNAEYGKPHPVFEQSSSWIRQNPTCFGHVPLLEVAERVERGEFSRTSDCHIREASVMTSLAYAMLKMVLKTRRPIGAPVAPPQSLRIIRALAALAKEDAEAGAYYAS